MSASLPRRASHPETGPVTLPRSEQWEFTSAAGRPYRVFLAWPEGEPDADWDVLYVLDANAWFATAVESHRVQSRRADKTSVRPAVIVGIGYPTDAPFDVGRRGFDLTPPVLEGAEPGPPGEGGADTLLDFITDELGPAVDRHFGLNSPRRAIFGHSLGGLLVLHAAFTRPGCFRAHAAASPSIWYQDRSILRREQAFVTAGGGGAPLALQITVGALETQSYPAGRRPEGPQPVHGGMAADARAMAERLAAAAIPGLDVKFHEFDGENHVSVVPGAISRALRFCLSAP